MISFSSNINLTAASIIFDEYIAILTEGLLSNNQLINKKISKIKELNLCHQDFEYVIFTLNTMKYTNNTYIELLSALKKQYTAFANQHFHKIPYYSTNNLDDILHEHMKNIYQNIFKQI